MLLGISFAFIAQADEWYPSRYGVKDVIGAANNLNADKVRSAASLVEAGKVYSLAVSLNSNWPATRGRTFHLSVNSVTSPLGPNKLTGHDDLLISHLALGTSVDGLGHVGINYRYYNGLTEEEVYSATGLKKLGLDKVPPIVTRGVLLDMASNAGVESLEAGTQFNSREIKTAAARQGIEIGKGDVVIFHTGWMAMLEIDPKRYMSEQPGLGKDGAQYLANLGVVLVGADTRTLEVQPYADGEIAPVHQILLARNGVYILEHVRTMNLAADKTYEFLFVMAAAKIEGAVQGMVHPVAIK
ncbi:MAG: cyclase family protein [Gammaproteobacteria bacterium]|nr:cyclase family protein [Gammaproteobacteria bacterium]